MKRFVLARDVAEDLEGIYQFIAQDSPAAGRRTIAKFLEAARKLARNPGMGHTRHDLAGDRPLLFWPVGSYLILYRAAKRPIEIAAVVHGERDIPAFLRRRGL